MILHINSKDQNKISVVMKKDGKVLQSFSEENKYGSQVLLPLIIKLLLRTSNPGLKLQNQSGIVNWKVLDGIEVETGPGSFTGIRVGVAVANSLGFALGILVNGEKMETKIRY